MSKRFGRIALIVLSILLIPLIAMQFTNEVNWGLLDFFIAAILLFTTGIILDFLIRKKIKYKSVLLLVIVITFMLIWAELAVGIFDTPFGGN